MKLSVYPKAWDSFAVTNALLANEKIEGISSAGGDRKQQGKICGLSGVSHVSIWAPPVWLIVQ